MSTCFQFENQGNDVEPGRRIKIYWKDFELFQSEGVMKSMGMRTKNLFCPDCHMTEALRQASNTGLSIIEMTITVRSKKQQDEIFNDNFVKHTNNELTIIFNTLKKIKGIYWHIPPLELYTKWQANPRQD